MVVPARYLWPHRERRNGGTETDYTTGLLEFQDRYLWGEGGVVVNPVWCNDRRSSQKLGNPYVLSTQDYLKLQQSFSWSGDQLDLTTWEATYTSHTGVLTNLRLVLWHQSRYRALGGFHGSQESACSLCCASGETWNQDVVPMDVIRREET